MNSLLGKHWHHHPTDEVLDLLDTNVQQGLDVLKVKHRQERFGLNVLTSKLGGALPASLQQPTGDHFSYSGKNSQQRLYKYSTLNRISLYN